MITKLPITEAIALLSLPVFDVRSPGEFEQAHIPGAINLPLFNNEERSLVGTIYKQQGRQPAIKAGLGYFGTKMRGMVEEVEAELRKRNVGNQLIVHCWRGGMRSAGVAWLLDLYGFKVHTIVGGYKAYRRWALGSFEKKYNMALLGGGTGSGKTKALKRLQSNMPVLHLEDISGHQGSAFGGINQPAQCRQEMFENKLALELYKLGNQFFLVEDESRRIGNHNIPIGIWQQMRNAKLYFAELPFEKRLQNITEDYGKLPLEKLSEATLRISKRLGPNETKMVLQHLQQNNIEAAFAILLTYYDKQYAKSMLQREEPDTQIIKFAATDDVDIAEKLQQIIKQTNYERTR